MALPLLAPDAKLSYFAEGGANVLFHIELPASATTAAAAVPLPETSASEDAIPLPTELQSYGPSTPPPSELEPGDTFLEDQQDRPNHSALDQSTSSTGPFSASLLRLRKALPNLTSALAAQRDFEAYIAPLFASDELVPQALVSVPLSTVDRLNGVLAVMDADGSRPRRRRGEYLERCEWGLVVRDMSRRTKDGSPGAVGGVQERKEEQEVTIELKPKWLLRSPNAPAGARKCRTCALRAMRRAREEGSADRKGLPAGGGEFCPLDLLARDEGRVRRAVRGVLEGCPPAVLERMAEGARRRVEERLVRYFWSESPPWLERLRELQGRFDREGILAELEKGRDRRKGEREQVSREFLIAMTVRDCTVYLKVPVEGASKIEARIGDLDLKSADKAEHWGDIERSLVDGGWYETGRDEEACGS